ncbi:putative signal transduction protein containing EAL and modified HD-GYP domain containing protein [Methylophaga aminisulfidivorans MP]|uniref:Histidine kinase n=2 Tax=Methylophaga TaxID=40222 RepID=A0ABQ5TUC8_9GAMM|nr:MULTISPECIES: HDOD domain-containing protein [Methylophaga]EGL53279.1 putative signal transduction protein containing EAL and modified HD-GYP domain containing protein [Methylophaga aminisulfidivorans MP]GLP99766.1 histidine kinase [Methylophaga thalassica]
MSDDADLSSIIIARQPIFDRHYNTYAYELLFRNNQTSQSADLDYYSGDIATTRVINYSFLELGIERVIGNHLAFVNLTRNFILSDDPIPFGGERVVLEVLENIEVDEELINAVKKLALSGYHIALDDFIFHESLRPLIELASIIKVDILSLSESELRHHVERLRAFPVKLLAEKVETKAEFELCMELGFDYFQGYFFCRPEIIKDNPIPDNKIKLLELLGKLQDPDIEFKTIEAIIRQDPGLSLKLLRLLNSAAIGFPRQINSLREGLVILGLKAIKTWTTLIVMSEMSSGPAELIHMTLVRAKMAEKIAAQFGCSPDSGFLLGLFSTIDTILSKPMDEIIKSIPLSNESSLALISRGGIKGQLLNCVTDYCEGHWNKVADSTGPSLEVMSNAYIEACHWATITLDTI